MPPWFADRRHGVFANDPSLTEAEIATVRDWVDAGAARGTTMGRVPEARRNGWTIGTPDLIVGTPDAVKIPASGDLDYRYLVLPIPADGERWVQAAEARSSNPGVVHHIVLYVREPDDPWLRDVPPNVLWAPSNTSVEEKRRIGHTTSDILMVYAPGSSPMVLPAGMAKRIKPGSDLVMQIHYTPNGKATEDRTQVALVFAKQPPAKQVLTLQMGTDRIRIPPGEAAYRRTVSGTLPNDALLLSFFPHLHLRGRSFEYRLVGAGGQYETLLRVDPYDFNWQMSYVLATPRPLKAGVRLQMEAIWDNSANNPSNPDPSAEVGWSEQSSGGEMMVGFFDVAVDAAVDKRRFFVRAP